MSEKPLSLVPAPEGYANWLSELKNCICSARQRAALVVNRELIMLYWQIGCDILQRQAEQGWGAKVIVRLAHDLRTIFPEMKGFSRANLMYMRSFADAWPDNCPGATTDVAGQAEAARATPGLRPARRGLRNVLNHEDWKKMEIMEAVDRVLKMVVRVLNPVSLIQTVCDVSASLSARRLNGSASQTL
ncbi:hypothetical protein MIM_c32310 [Advenella mimigardefordensis DPN7]|uniref:YhcG N-terminal domain-containing protein n=1 Tax=Advenella mimigardefordensis (strain DSM 17166 / LMG 22922 / DPN7) TaxID=1247726 RepID=W0PIK9_ADVMD|nr:hypothetical protein MIM_c32310 [Advenella mimigardefordensis DPN7]